MRFFDSLFRKKKTSTELLRENRRELNRTIRQLDRENNHLTMQEQKTIADMKQSAKSGQMGLVRSMAKHLVKTRHQQKKLLTMRANIQSVALQLQGLTTQDAMTNAMRNVVGIMSTMNHQLDLPKFREIMGEFEKESVVMDIKEELMGTAIDDVLGESEEELETEGIVQQILDELGIQLGEKLGNLPVADTKLNSSVASPTKRLQAVALSDVDANLQARLDRLHR